MNTERGSVEIAKWTCDVEALRIALDLRIFGGEERELER